MPTIKTHRPIQELAQEALDVQNACNLSGVIHRWSDVISDLWSIAQESSRGTEWVNRHPINKAFASKVGDLSGLDIGPFPLGELEDLIRS